MYFFLNKNNKTEHICGDGEKLITLLFVEKHFHLITNRKSFLTDRADSTNHKYCEECDTRYYGVFNCKCSKLAFCSVCEQKCEVKRKVVNGKIMSYSKCCESEVDANNKDMFACVDCNSMYTERFNSIKDESLGYNSKGEIYYTVHHLRPLLLTHH